VLSVDAESFGSERGRAASPEAAAALEEDTEPEISSIVVEKRFEKTSVAAAEFANIKHDARRTLSGLRWFQACLRYAVFSSLLALPALAALAAVVLNGGGITGPLVLAASWLGAAAFALFLVASVFGFFGILAMHGGRDELGTLQSREVRRAGFLWIRALIVFLGGAASVYALGLQADTLNRPARIEWALLGATIIALVACGYTASLVAKALQSYVRTLAPRTGRRGRGRFRRRFIFWVTPAAAIALAGLPLIMIDYDQACVDLGGCPADRVLLMFSPSFGPGLYFVSHPLIASYAYLPLIVLLILVLSRLSALSALRAMDMQLKEAERLILQKLQDMRPPPTQL